MAHDVVRLAEQFILAVTADLDEARVDIGDPALDVGRRNEFIAVFQYVFVPVDGQVVAQAVSPST